MMFTTALLASCLATLATAQKKSLVVDDPPNFVRPYVVPHLRGPVLQLGDTAFRFPVTGASSGGQITLLSTNGDASKDLNVFPHRHVRRYENFFCSRGGVQLWTQQYNGTQKVRKMTAGDYGGSPSNATHTFQITEPNTEMYGVVFAGGLEDMFFAMAPNITYSTYGPFDPAAAASAGFGSSGQAPPTTSTPPANSSSGMRGGTRPPALQVLAEAPPDFSSLYDIYPNLDFVPRRDLVNGSGPASTWHTAPSVLPTDPNDPFYIARDLGPKYLNKENGYYQVIQPLNTAKQSTYHNFTLSFISLGLKPNTTTIPTRKFAGHAGFRVEEGALNLEVEGYDEIQLLAGDVAFIPGGTSYKYYSKVTFTKALYFAAETNGLDTALIAKGSAWNSAIWPVS